MTIRILLVLACCVMADDSSAGEIYKCSSQDGKTTYSDSPCPGAKKIPPIVSPASNPDNLSSADDWPSLRSGEWRLNGKENERTVTQEGCEQWDIFLKKVTSDLEEPGCKRSRLRKTGNQYGFNFECRVSNSSAKDQRANGRFTLTTMGTDEFAAEILAEKNGNPWTGHIEGRRVSDCDHHVGPRYLPTPSNPPVPLPPNGSTKGSAK